jgi:predicted metal-binding protein
VTLTHIDDDTRIEAHAGATIYVCVTCRQDGDPEGEERPGEMLARATARAAEGTGIGVRRIICLGNCSKGPSAALRSAGSWTYVFGGLDPERDAGALVEGMRLLARAPDGIMPWRGRPEVLKRGLIARVPPFGYIEEET